MTIPSSTTDAPTDGSRFRTITARVLLFVWAPMVLLVLSSLMTGHWAPLPTPQAHDATLRRGLAELPARARFDDWTAYHVLYSGCRCSRFVFDYVAERPTPTGLREVVLLVGAPDEEFAAACRERDMPCIVLSQEQLEQRFGIEAAPLLLVTAPGHEVAYLGGYTDRKQAIDYRDLEIVERLRAGEQVDPMPVFGCGVSSSLQDALDPFGIKY
ncbi:MAG: hypothetical protein ACE37K_21165 [Planctomycetota bacterium]